MVFDSNGIILSRSQNSYDVVRPQPDFEEQNPQTLYDVALKTIGECLGNVEASQIAGICFSSQMYGVFAVDEDGNPLCNNILWSDARATEEEKYIKENFDSNRITEETGCPVNSIYPLAKILWLKNHLPGVFRSAYKFISIKDLIIHELTGLWVSDYSMLSATGFFDIGTKKWSQYALSVIGLASSRLPKPISGESKLKFSNELLLKLWNLSPEVSVILGAGDGPLANLGSGACNIGQVNIDLGTSGAIRTIIDHPPRESKSGLWCYCLAEKRWAYGGILTNVGNAFSWLSQNVAEFDNDADLSINLDRLDFLAEKVTPGSEGLLFLPYLRAPRSPYWDSSLKSLMYGMVPSMNLGHIARAMLEAFAYDISFILDSIMSESSVADFILFTGGLSKSKLLCRILADVTGKNIRVPSCSEGSIRGAAILGFKSLGIINELSFPHMNSDFQEFKADVQNSETYALSKKRYGLLVKASKQIGIELE